MSNNEWSDKSYARAIKQTVDNRFERFYDKPTEIAIEEMACWLSPDGIGYDNEADFYNMVAAIKADFNSHAPTELSK